MNSTPDLAAPRTEAAPARSPGRARAASRILIIMVTAVLALVAAFTGVLSNPTLKSAEVGLVAQGPAGAFLLGCTLAYSALSAVAGVVLTGPVMGVLTGSPAQLIGAGTLIVFTVATFTAALMSLLGMPGLIIAIGTLVILGNPTSGGSVPVQMMTGGWRFLAHVLPTNAGVSFIRSSAYLDGNQMNDPLTVLLIYTAVSVLVLLGLAIRRAAARPAAPAVTVTPASTPA
jgi:hypothetical protein